MSDIIFTVAKIDASFTNAGKSIIRNIERVTSVPLDIETYTYRKITEINRSTNPAGAYEYVVGPGGSYNVTTDTFYNTSNEVVSMTFKAD